MGHIHALAITLVIIVNVGGFSNLGWLSKTVVQSHPSATSIGSIHMTTTGTNNRVDSRRSSSNNGDNVNNPSNTDIPKSVIRNGPGDKPGDKVTSFAEAVHLLRHALSTQKYQMFVRIMKNFAFGIDRGESEGTSNPIRTKAGVDMLTLINEELDNFDANTVTESLWSIGKVGYRLSTPLEREVTMRLLNRLCLCQEQGDELTSRQVTTSIGGLAKLGLKWNFVPKQTKDDLVKMVGYTATSLNDREVSNLLHSLSKMLTPWSAFPRQVQAGLLESFVRESQHLVSQQGSMSIYSLGLMGLQIDGCTPAIRDRIYVVALNVLREDSKNAVTAKSQQQKRYACQQVSNVIYGLAKAGARYQSLPPHVKKTLEDAVLQSLALMNEQEVSNTVYSHGIMGASWEKDMTPEMQDLFKSIITSRIPNMITQGVSNTVYGMGLMDAPWLAMGDAYTNAVLAAITYAFRYQDGSPQAVRVVDQSTDGVGALLVDTRRVRVDSRSSGPQAIANVIYSLGVVGAEWNTFPTSVQNAIADGLEQWGQDLSSQEMSNAVYGLGLLRAQYSLLPPRMRSCLSKMITRVVCYNSDSVYGTTPGARRYEKVALVPQPGALNEQEVCSTLHGFAKMQAKWEDIPQEIRFCLLEMTAQLAEMGSLCLACTVYSLGILEAKWADFPKRIKALLVSSAGERPLEDQTMANVVYGFSLLGLSWGGMDTHMRQVLVTSLARDECFSANTSACSQHICNTIWGLAKMDATWDYLPQKSIVTTLSAASHLLTCQETANAVYGFAIMDASWKGLPSSVHSALLQAVERNIGTMTTQEVANCMYSFALLTFDYPYVPARDSNEAEMLNIWTMHALFIDSFSKIERSAWSVENFDQFAIYFELMQYVPGGKEFVEARLGHIPVCSGPSGTVPSRLHTSCAQHMLESLNQTPLGMSGPGERFAIFNEFNGLGGVFPIDIGVYFDSALVAFVEIDGEFHYKFDPSEDPGQGRRSGPTQLRRKDRLKEFCYRGKFSHVPLFRIRSDQCDELGFARAGAALAGWIVSNLNTRSAAAVASGVAAGNVAKAGKKGEKVEDKASKPRVPRAKKAAAAAAADADSAAKEAKSA